MSLFFIGLSFAPTFPPNAEDGGVVAGFGVFHNQSLAWGGVPWVVS
jgi:hypothetical protein